MFRVLYRRIKWVYQKFHLNYALPFVVLVSYTLFGAAIFRSLELERDKLERDTFNKSYHYALNQVIQRVLEVRCHDIVLRANEELQLLHARDAMMWFVDYLNLTQVIQERADLSPWSWYGSMFYAGQLYTTIGYGLPVAKTRAGQIASIFYIMLGIPIFLIILKEVGCLLSKGFRKIYKRLRSAKNKLPPDLRRMSIMPPKKGAAFSNPLMETSGGSILELKKDEIIEVEREIDPTAQNMLNKRLSQENAFPIPIALMILILWICFSAALFCLWETEWGYLTSVYFFFVSISTVGLGDVVPGNKDMMLVNFVLILIGLALLSMCINLIQVAIERMIDRLLQQYIEEIERVAAIVNNDVAVETETAAPFEIGVSSDLMTMPFVSQQKSTWSFPRSAKDWVAGKIANNLIVSRLDPKTDSDSEEEEEKPAQQQSPQRQKPSLTRNLRFRGRRYAERLNTNKPLFRTVRALEKARIATPKDDFQSMLFSKFITNTRLERLVEDCEEEPTMVSTSTQTNLVASPVLASPEQDITRDESLWEISSVRTRNFDSTSNLEGESMYSRAYDDVHFENAACIAPLTSAEILQSDASLDGIVEDAVLDRSYYDAPTIMIESTPEGERTSGKQFLHIFDVANVPCNGNIRSPKKSFRNSSYCHSSSPSLSSSSVDHQARRSFDDGLLRASFLDPDRSTRSSSDTFGRPLAALRPPSFLRNVRASSESPPTSHPQLSRQTTNDDNGVIDSMLGTREFQDTSYCT